MYTEHDEHKGSEATEHNIVGSTSYATGFMENHSQDHPVPKLEDFLGDSTSSIMRYSDSQTDTQDSSTLTHIYEHGSAYFSDHQDLKAITGFQAFSTNSGSEVDDSASMGKNQPEFVTYSIDSSGNELAYSNGGAASGTLSLAVTATASAAAQCGGDQKSAVVAVDSDGSKKMADTFGQRTSIYRGVTRYSIFKFIQLCYFPHFKISVFSLKYMLFFPFSYLLFSGSFLYLFFLLQKCFFLFQVWFFTDFSLLCFEVYLYLIVSLV